MGKRNKYKRKGRRNFQNFGPNSQPSTKSDAWPTVLVVPTQLDVALDLICQLLGQNQIHVIVIDECHPFHRPQQCMPLPSWAAGETWRTRWAMPSDASNSSWLVFAKVERWVYEYRIITRVRGEINEFCVLWVIDFHFVSLCFPTLSAGEHAKEQYLLLGQL